MTVKPVPDGYTITPYLTIHGATQRLELVKQAFDAVETECMRLPDGSVLYLYLPDMQAAFDKAVAAGGEVFQEPEDHFCGDRSGAVKDPTGNIWYLSTHIEDVPPDELERRAAAMGQGG